MCLLPLEVSDDERLVRAIGTPQHYDAKKGKLKPAAFRPKEDVCAISVIRQIMGDNFCKDKGVEIVGMSYLGLAVISSERVREIGSSVYDHRVDFCGHAHIDHGVPAPPKNDPLSSEVNATMYLRWKALSDACIFHVDEKPSALGWSGPPL